MHLQTNFSPLSFSYRAYQHYIKLEGVHDLDKKKNDYAHKLPVPQATCLFRVLQVLHV